ncbi:MAG: EFR1 family ferrodoxin [Coriobacteriales bacterium]|jgi:ferredoxin/flavodoxin|nr:EFR1 family ferrodoxin [Coriobacteriales bacterium]
MSKTTIYYFSATGNSLAVARHLTEALDVEEPISVPGSLINEDPYLEARGATSLGFVFPVQRATIPEMLRGFIQSMPIDPHCYYFAISTYSLFGSNEFWDIDELLVSKGAALNYAASVKMMGNVGIVGPSTATINKRLERMEHQVDGIATAIAYHQQSFFPRANKLLGWAVKNFTHLYRKYIVFRIDKRCKGCGICVQVCPAQNIQLQKTDSEVSAPIRSDKCEACLACVHWCPASAVRMSKRRHTSYHNPRVLPEELNPKKPKAASAPPAEVVQRITEEPEIRVLLRDQEKPSGAQKQSMSDAEIAEALSSLES